MYFFSPASARTIIPIRSFTKEVLKRTTTAFPVYNAMIRGSRPLLARPLQRVHVPPVFFFHQYFRSGYLPMAAFYGLVLLTLYNSYRRFGLRRDPAGGGISHDLSLTCASPACSWRRFSPDDDDFFQYHYPHR